MLFKEIKLIFYMVFICLDSLYTGDALRMRVMIIIILMEFIRYSLATLEDVINISNLLLMSF